MSTPPFLPNPILITGMHRSGTTLVARMLQTLGVFMGHHLDDNHEALAFLDLNDRVLHRAHAAWDRPGGVEDLLELPVVAEALVDALREATRTPAFARAYRGHAGASLQPPGFAAWGFKDPRTSVTWPLWLRVFQDARMIHVRRHGVDVAASLARRSAELLDPGKAARFARRDGMARFVSVRCASLPRASELWRETEALYRRLRARHPAPPVLEILYEELVANPSAALDAMARHLALTPTPAQHAAAASLAESGRSFAFRADAPLAAFAREQADDPALDAWRGFADFGSAAP